MSDDSSDDDFTIPPFPDRAPNITINPVLQEPLVSMEPFNLKTIVLSIYIKFDKDKRLENLITELQEPYRHLPKGPNGEHVSILHQYALESTRDLIDMSNQNERFIYQPNLAIRKNDAFGPWIFNHLLSLLSIDYQYDLNGETQFPPVWKTDSQTKVLVRVKSIQNKVSGSTEIANSTTISTKKEAVSLEDFLKAVCRHNQRNENSAKNWLSVLQEESIATIEHLRSAVANERCWDSLQSLKYIVKQMIRDYIQLNDSSSKSGETQSLYKDSDATLIGDIHRIRRYFHYVTKTEQYVSYLDPEAVESAIHEIRRTYDDDGKVLYNIHQYLKTFCIENKSIDEAANDRRRREWIEENTRMMEEVEKIRNEILIAGQEAKGAEKKVEILKERLNNEIKEKNKALKDVENLKTETVNVDSLIRKRDQAKLKAAQGTKNVKEVQAELEHAQAKLALHTEPMIQKRNKIAEIEEKVRNLTAFLNINPKEAQKKLNVKYGRGLLLYGPPGTGKSELLKRAAIFAGITMTTTALAAGELNRPYVGETERLLVDIMSRASTIPYLICAMTIDEIDGLVPKRTSNSQQSKVDGISVLLSHIEGVKNIPNMIVLGATNRKNMMDEAFLRRMQAKCFVGRPSPQIRKKMLEPLLYLDVDIFNDKRMEFLVKITTNFSGAAVGALKSSIVVAMDSYKRSEVTDKIFLDLADNAAREFSCWFGTGTLPEICRLYPNIFSSHNQQEKYSLKFPHCHPSGRILIDLESRKYLIEFKNEPTIEGNLDEEETSTLTLISRLINGCLSRNIDTIQMVDLNYLTKNNAFDENAKFEVLTSLFDECEEYNRSMLVFDIDSLVMVSVTDSAMSESNSISNMQLYQFIRENCKRAVVEHNATNKKSEKTVASWKEKWKVMIVKRQYLRDLLIKEIDFKKTLQQSNQEHEEEEKRLENETTKQCPKCLKSYIPAQVNHGSCQYHDAYVVDLDHPAEKLTQIQANEKWQKAELEASIRVHENSNEKTPTPQLYWACCSNRFKSGQTCKIDTCGLPEKLKQSFIDSKTDLVMLVQEYFQQNTEAERNIAKLVKHYQTLKSQARSSAQNLAANNQTRQLPTVASAVKKN